MKRTMLSVLMLLIVATMCAQADVLFDSGPLSFAQTGTQLGRLSRNGVIPDWTTPSTFPGVINTSTTYGFETLTFNTGQYGYLAVYVDSLSGSLFVSVYKNSYDPTNLMLNYLSDAGSSGNLFGTDPIAFYFIADPYTDLVLVINETTAGAGRGQLIEVASEGFCDTDYNDAPGGTCAGSTNPVPEPGSMMLLGTGLSLVVTRLRKRYSA
jgi:hypothetical protein